MWPQRPAHKPVLAAALFPESVLISPNRTYLLIFLKIVEKVVMYEIDRRGVGEQLTQQINKN